MLPTTALLALSICAVWAPDVQLGRKSIPPWSLLFLAALASGLAASLLDWTALIPLALLGLFCLLAAREMRSSPRAVFTAVVAILALVLALHIAPGFNNPVLLRDVHVSAGASPFTQYASLDKAAAGLLVLALLSRRCASRRDWRDIAGPTLLGIAATALIVMSFAVLTGYVRLDWKLPSITLTFLVINLLFTCIAEEAFFRGLLQERVIQALPGAAWAAVSLSALLFGIAHFAGGALNVVLATIAGTGYALVYQATRRVEAAILTHFAVNLIHFIGFTYPRLAL